MRIYRDLDLVEHLGSGIPRILQAYSRDQFNFMDNFLQVILPIDEDLQALMQQEETTMQVPRKYPASTPQVQSLLSVFEGAHHREDLQNKLGLSDREYFRKNYLNPAIEEGLVALTIPDKPTSSKQQYFLTEKGKEVRHLITNDK